LKYLSRFLASRPAALQTARDADQFELCWNCYFFRCLVKISGSPLDR
jgi:hypothetical protein